MIVRGQIVPAQIIIWRPLCVGIALCKEEWKLKW